MRNIGVCLVEFVVKVGDRLRVLLVVRFVDFCIGRVGEFLMKGEIENVMWFCLFVYIFLVCRELYCLVEIMKF